MDKSESLTSVEHREPWLTPFFQIHVRNYFKFTNSMVYEPGGNYGPSPLILRPVPRGATYIGRNDDDDDDNNCNL